MKIQVGDVFESKKCGKFEVVAINSYKDVIIKFLNTGYSVSKRSCDIPRGEIKDPLYPSIFNKGFIGVGKWKTKKDRKLTREYVKWTSMMKRCYSNNYRKHSGNSYDGCTVCDRWLNFQNFCEDLPNLPGYDLFISGELVHLDKDITVRGNTMYDPKLCRFTLPKENLTAERTLRQ